MSDIVKIRVTYPNQEAPPASGAGWTAAAPSASPEAGAARARGVSPVLFAVIGLLVVAGGVGAGLFYTTVSGRTSPAAMTSEADARSTGADAAAASAKASSDNGEPAGQNPRAETPAPLETAPASAVADEIARFETAGAAAARETDAISSPPVTPSALAAAAEPELEPEVTDADILEEPAYDVAALPPPLKRPVSSEAKATALAPASSSDGPVARSQLTSAVRAREPVDRLSSRVKIGEGGSRKLFYFTELQGLNGETVYHRWEHAGRTIVTLRFDVGSDRWRAYSSKMIPANQTGDWRVVVANAEGDVLASSQFVAE